VSRTETTVASTVVDGADGARAAFIAAICAFIAFMDSIPAAIWSFVLGIWSRSSLDLSTVRLRSLKKPTADPYRAGVELNSALKWPDSAMSCFIRAFQPSHAACHCSCVWPWLTRNSFTCASEVSWREPMVLESWA
jgi:hypothetical protein